MDKNTESTNPLATKVDEWLRHEGYPLEYITAATFHQMGFGIWQGVYVRSSSDENPREIDVIGLYDSSDEDVLLRVEYVIECKWSRDKPWVVFTSPFRQMSTAACVNQTIASEFGRAALWLQAGDQRFTRLASFATPRVPGFGGRQALTQAKDTFYASVQSVVTACSLRMSGYDEPPVKGVSLPRAAVIAFPVVVIDGTLFEAYPVAGGPGMALREVKTARLHWKGSAAWRYNATVDIVSIGGLAQYAEQRANEAASILRIMRTATTRIAKFAQSGKRADLRITRGSRGTLGPPSLIARLIRAHQDATTAARKRLKE
jgi:hypothetical protein